MRAIRSNIMCHDENDFAGPALQKDNLRRDQGTGGRRLFQTRQGSDEFPTSEEALRHRGHSAFDGERVVVIFWCDI